MVVKNWLRVSYSIHAPILKRDKKLHFSKYKTLEYNRLTFQKWPFSGSTLDPATHGNPYQRKGFSILRMSAETATRQLNDPFRCEKT